MVRKKSNIINHFFSYYIWIIPAFLFLMFFLILPSLQTIVMSFTSDVRISDQAVLKKVISAFKKITDQSVTEDDYFLEIQGWEDVIKHLEKENSITIDRTEIDHDMTVGDTSEYIVIILYDVYGDSGKSKQFSGLKNYLKMFTDRDMQIAFRNNLLWLVFFTIFTVGAGLVIAKIMEQIRWSIIARSIIFIPMSISYVASGVIWAFMYARSPQIGTINAFLTTVFSAVGINYEPVAFLGRTGTVNPALILAGIWVWSGFCMVILRAALNNISSDLIDAARIDGASGLRIFFQIEIPVIGPTILVVTTTMIINVLKIFDIVYTMTGGGPFGSSEVIANRMYRTAFNEGNFEYASAMAVVLFLAIVPVMVLNIKNFLREEEDRM